MSRRALQHPPSLPDWQTFSRSVRRSAGALALAIGVPALLLLGLVFYLLNSAARVEDASRVIAGARTVEKLLIDMQAGLRGYQVTGDERFMKPYTQAIVDFDSAHSDLSRLVENKPEQSASVASLAVDAATWKRFAVEALAQKKRAGTVQEVAFQLRGKALMDETLGRLSEIVRVEQARHRQQAGVLKWLRRALVAGLAATALVAAPLASRWIVRRLRKTAATYERSLAMATRRATELEVTLSSIGDAVVTTNASGEIIFLNSVAERLTGWTTREATGLPLSEVFKIFNEETGTPAENPVERVLRERKVAGLANHTVLRSRTGAETPIEDSAAPIFDAAGQVRGVILVFHDVAEKRRAARELEEAELRARTALELGRAGGWTWELESDRVNADGVVARTFGLPAERCLHGLPVEAFLARIDEADQTRVRETIRLAVENGEPYEMEFGVSSEDGEHRWVKAHGGLENALPGRPARLVGLVVDITAAHLAEQALRESETLKTAIIDTALDGFILMDHEGLIRDWNAAAEQIFGWTRAEALGRALGATIVPDRLREAHRRGLDRYMSTREAHILGQRLELPALRADGTEFIAEISISHIPGTQPPLFAGYIRDISEREEATLLVAESAERFRVLSEVVALQVWTATPDGALDFANQECVEYLDADSEREILGDRWAQFVHPEDLPATAAAWKSSLETGTPYQVEFRLRGRDGQYRWFLTRAQAMRGPDGEVVKWFGTNTDTHKLKLAQEQAEHANRAKDEFLAALSHELRMPLTPVLMSAAAMREDERLPADVREQLAMMERNISLEARLIDDLLDLTRIARGKLHLRRQPCDVHSLINLAVEIVHDEAQSKGMKIARDLAAHRSGLEVDPARFQQVMWNLLRNAVKFTPTGGSVFIRTSDMENGSDESLLRIEVADTGVGISEPQLDIIFSPFEQGGYAGDHRFGGIGLGLAIARAIVDLHGGKIEARSDGENRGATFIVELPGAKLPPQGMLDGDEAPVQSLLPGSFPPETQRPVMPRLRLLVVEDHEPTLTVLARLLVRSGHDIVTAGNVIDALAAAKEDTFDLVISDLGLPDGTGTELMTKLRDNHGLRGIALTGYGMDEDIARSREAGFIAHLIKPIDFHNLEQALRMAVTGRA